MENSMNYYQVIVGNIGTVYNGPRYSMAQKCYAAYEFLVNRSFGRASGEAVVLLKNGEIYREVESTLPE